MEIEKLVKIQLLRIALVNSIIALDDSDCSTRRKQATLINSHLDELPSVVDDPDFQNALDGFDVFDCENIAKQNGWTYHTGPITAEHLIKVAIEAFNDLKDDKNGVAESGRVIVSKNTDDSGCPLYYIIFSANSACSIN